MMQKKAWYIWYVVIILWVVNIFNYIDRLAVAILLPDIKADLGLTDSEIGILVGFAFALFYALCGIPIARIADRTVRKNLIALALAGWSIATALTGAATNFWHLFIARIGVGVGEAGCIPPAQSLICDYVPLRYRPAALAFHSFGLTVGMMLGISCAGILADMVGWRWAFVILGLPGVLLAGIVILTITEPVRGALDIAKAKTPNSPPFMQAFSELWRIKTYRFLLIVFGANGFTLYALSQWWPSFFARTFQLEVSEIGPSLGLAIGIGTGAGTLLGGTIASRAGQGAGGGALRLSAAFAAITLPAALGSILTVSFNQSIMFVAAAAFAGGVGNGPVLGALYSVVPPNVRATAGSIPILFAAIFGFGMGPMFVGIASDLLAPTLGNMSLRYALILPALAIPITVSALWAASRSLASDMGNGRTVPKES